MGYRGKNLRRADRSGFAVISALALLVVMTTLAMTMAVSSSSQLSQASNLQKIFQAQYAAESGLAFANRQLSGLTLGELPADTDALWEVASTLSASLDGNHGLPDGSVTWDESDPANPKLIVPAISLPSPAKAGDTSFDFVLKYADANSLLLTVTGHAGPISRRVAMTYTLGRDTRILSYAVGSRPRIIARGDIQIEGDLCSTWTRTSEAAPLDVSLGSNGDVTGQIKTILSQDDFDEHNSGDYIVGDAMQDKLRYDEPPFADYSTGDFDTTAYKSLATNALPSYDYQQWEGFPETRPSKWYRRKFYVGTKTSPKVLNNVTVPAGKHAHFKHCKFTGYTYIEAGNNIVFEDCTFEGPIITGVPDEFHWINHALYFKGDTAITNTVMPESTILAPNFNVNIGDFSKQGQSSESKVTGILVGGIVDIRDNATIEGTILSMANLDHISSSIYKYGTNLGYWEDDSEESGGALPETSNIRIIPQPDNPLPMGMKTSYRLAPIADTYSESAEQ